MKIRAAVFREGSAEPNIEELELAGPGAGEVLVRMVATVTEKVFNHSPPL